MNSLRNFESFPLTRMRRNRLKNFSRNLLRENNISINDIILPLFVIEGKKKSVPITSMPGVSLYTPDSLIKIIEEAVKLGINAVALFPNIEHSLKDDKGSYALDPNNLICRTVKLIKSEFPDLGIICDVALDPYTTHGHDGIYINGEILNDKTVEILCDQAIVQVNAGCDILAPSDMMDGRVYAIRQALESHNLSNTQIMSYSVKYASSFYSPFREAIGSSTILDRKVDKRSYQMDPSNSREAIREVNLDISEGADMVIIKPGMPYLDIIFRINQECNIPIFAYQVSGEYSMLCDFLNNNKNDRENIILETILSFKRAGANGVITYFAIEIANLLKSNNSF